MRSMLKMAVSVFSTLVAANLMAQCGPQGCGFGGGYQGGYGGGYYDNNGYGGGYGGGYVDQGYHDGGYYQGHGYGMDHGYQGGMDHGYYQGGHGAMPQGQHYHDGVYGYDQPMQDHPVYDNSGQHVKYYGKPGPDYNQQTNQPGSAQPAGNPTSYNYSTSYDWDRLADAGSATSTNPYGNPNQPAAAPSGSTAGSTGTSSTTSKW